MNVWIPSPDLLPGEVVQFQALANHLVGRRPVGGQVTVTDQRLLFVPNRLDRLTGGRYASILRSGITDLQVLAPGAKAARSRGLAASLRPQLAIESQNETAIIVTADLDILQAALAS